MARLVLLFAPLTLIVSCSQSTPAKPGSGGDTAGSASGGNGEGGGLAAGGANGGSASTGGAAGGGGTGGTTGSGSGVSPAIDAGSTIASNGGLDFWGTSLTRTPDIGAHEFR